MGATCCSPQSDNTTFEEVPIENTQKNRKLHEILSSKDRFVHEQCVLCKKFKQQIVQNEFQLSEYNSIVVASCQDCLKSKLTQEQKDYLLYLDHDPQNSLYFKIEKSYPNNHKKTEVTDILSLLANLVYYEDNWEQEWKQYLENPVYKTHLENITIKKKKEYALLAVDDVNERCYFAFRGTKLDAGDLWNDLQIAFTGTAHSRLDKMDDFYDEEKKPYMKKNYKIIVTGHSLGGNVAENILITNDEVHHCESFNAGNTLDFMPDILEDWFDCENEETLKQMTGNKTNEQIAKELGENVEKVRERINKAQNSKLNRDKEREERIISHRIEGDPISIEKIYRFSHRYEVKTDKKLFAAHLMDNFLGLIEPFDDLYK